MSEWVAQGVVYIILDSRSFYFFLNGCQYDFFDPFEVTLDQNFTTAVTADYEKIISLCILKICPHTEFD